MVEALVLAVEASVEALAVGGRAAAEPVVVVPAAAEAGSGEADSVEVSNSSVYEDVARSCPCM